MFTINSDGVKLTGAATGVAGQALEFNMAYLGAQNTARIADLAAKAPLASPTFTGTATAAALAVTGDMSHAGNLLDKVLALTDGTTITWDLALGDMATVTLGGNRTLALSTNHSGSFSILIKQDATGSRLLTWPSSVKWPGGTAPTLSTTANAVDVVTLMSFDGGTTYRAVFVGAFA